MCCWWNDAWDRRDGLDAMGLSGQAAPVSALGVPRHRRASKGSMPARENRSVDPWLWTAAGVVVAGAAASSWFQAGLSARPRRCLLVRSPSMLIDPAPKLATWNRPPAMALFLKKWISWF